MSLRKCAPWLFEGKEHVVLQSEAAAVERYFSPAGLPPAEARARAAKWASGWLPLHRVARYAKGKYSIAVFVPIFNAYPSAANARNPNGWLPLHFVAQNMDGTEGLEAIQLLLEEYPQAAKEENSNGALALHLVATFMGGAEGLEAIQLLLKEYPQAARTKDKCGDLPIHDICHSKKGATLAMVRELLSAYPHGVHEEGDGSEKPYAKALRLNCLPADAVDFLRRAEQNIQIAAALRCTVQERLQNAGAPELLAESIRAMPFETFCKLWSLTSAFDGSISKMNHRDHSEDATVFEPLVALFEAWAARHPPLSGVANVLRIAAAAEQLIRALSNTRDSGPCAEGFAHVDELEKQTAATESAAQRFRHAHEALAEAVTQTLEAGSDALSPGLVEARDAAFVELQTSLQLLEERSSRLSLDDLHTATSALLKSIESASAFLERTTGVQLAAVFKDDMAASDDNNDRRAVDIYGAMLRRAALGIWRRIQHSAASAERFADRCLARDSDNMLEAASDLRDSICSIVALEGEGGDMSLPTVLRNTTRWRALLASTARRLASLRAVSERTECIQSRVTALRSEVSVFVSGFAGRERGISLLEETYRAMKRARNSYRRLKLDHDANSDDDSDAGGVDPTELARQREACRVATASRDAAARQLFLAAKAYHPETLVEQQKRLRLTGLAAIWSERTLEEYDNFESLAQQGESRHAMLKATFAGKLCVLKLVQLQRGQALCKEAEILRRLNHPNIVKLDASFVHDNLLYLHFPYAKHGDLQQYLEVQAETAAGARISAAQLRRMARQLCEALSYLAERSIVHCDVKPANVFVAEEDSGSMLTAILGDFDVSHTASGRTATLTMALQTRGIATHYTAGYAAPEVVRAQPGQPPRATNKLDIYGLGCVIYHMHMYPRALPEPERLDDDVASRAGLFEEAVGGAVPKCAVPAWAAAVPRDVVADATRVDPIARLSARELLQTAYMRQADGAYAYVEVQRPAYWQYQEHTGSWLVRESAEVVTQVEKLLNDTARPEEHGTGRDSHDLPFAHFKVTSVQRVENSVVWSAYAARRRALADTLAGEGYSLPEPARQLSTSHFFYPIEGGSLEGAAGEVFLFHGTRFPESIASSGFDVRYAYAGAGAGAMFGRGVYFAESVSKSDQYVSRSAAGKLTLVLARVCLGRCQVVRDGRGRCNAPFLPEVKGKSTAVVPVYYDSILTEVPGMRFREVVVGRDTAAYPELLVEYERV